MSDTIQVGMTGEKSEAVTEEKTALHLGSGGLLVYATPAMVALMEYAAVDAIDSQLPEGHASVGVELTIKHIAATPVGDTVRAEAEVTEVDGRRVTFKVAAYDSQEVIGEGTHVRFVIVVARFQQRLDKKR